MERSTHRPTLAETAVCGHVQYKFGQNADKMRKGTAYDNIDNREVAIRIGTSGYEYTRTAQTGPGTRCEALVTDAGSDAA